MFPSVNMGLLVLLFIIVWCIRYNWKRRHLVKLVEKFDGPPTLPLLGNYMDLPSNPIGILNKCLKLIQKYGSLFRLWVGNMPLILISNVEDIQIVARDALEKDRIVYSFIADGIGNGLFTSTFKKWKVHRPIFNSAFNPIILSNGFMKVFNKCNSRLIERLKTKANTGNQFDIFPYIISANIDIIKGTALRDEEETDDSKMSKYIESVTRYIAMASYRIFQPWLYPSVIFSIFKYMKGYNQLVRIIHEFPLEMIGAKKNKWHKETEHELSSADECGKTFIDILIDSYKRQLLTEEDVKDEIITIVPAGSETTAVTSSFLILMLAMRQDIQEKVYQELYEVFEKSDRSPTMKDLMQLIYLEQCLNETMRRFTLVPVIFRQAEVNIELTNKHVIPAGAHIGILIAAVHLNPHIYPDPLKWDPSNFDPDKVANRHSLNFIPFSTGPRRCLGEKYAYVAMKAQISTILRNFKLTTNHKMDDIKITMDFLLRSEQGYQVKLESRNKN